MSNDELVDETLGDDDDPFAAMGEVLGDGDLEDADLAESDLAEDDLDDDDLGSSDSGSFDEDETDTVADDEPSPGSLDAAEDGDDEHAGEPAVDLAVIDGLDEVVVGTDDDADADDTLRPDEFVCRSCHMARRGSALADPDAMLCRDCV